MKWIKIVCLVLLTVAVFVPLEPIRMNFLCLGVLAFAIYMMYRKEGE